MDSKTELRLISNICYVKGYIRTKYKDKLLIEKLEECLKLLRVKK